MTLYDIFMVTQYEQRFFVYTENTYDECVYMGDGNRAELMDENMCNVFDVLNNKVTRILSCKDGAILVVVKHPHYKKHTCDFYSKDRTKKWDDNDPTTRPWRFSYEMIKECEAYE